MSSGLQDIQLKILLDVRGLNSVGQVNNSLKGMHKAATSVGKASDVLTKSQANQAKGLKGLLQKVNEAEHQYDALYRASYRLKQAGDDLRNAGMAGIGVLKNSVDAWGDYEFSLNRAAGALLTNRNMLPQLSQGILDVAKNVRLYKPEEVAKATYYWASTTGQQVKSMNDLKVAMAGVTPILKAAALTETDMEAAIKGVFSILVQYNKPLSKTTDVTEKLMLITQRTALEFPDLINSFKMLGPVARANGMTFEQVAQALGMIGDAGIRGTMSGRALRQFFIQLVRPSDKAKNALNKVFKETFHLSNAYKKMVFPKGKFIGLSKYVKYLADVTKGMNQQQRNSFLATITTANELPVLTALLQRELDVRKGIVKANDAQKYSLKGAHKAFEDSFGLLANSWKGLMGLLENSFMPIVLQVGKTVADITGPIIKNISDILTQVKKWMDENPKMVDFIVKLLGVASVIAAVVGGVLVFVGALMGISAGLGFVASAFGGIIAPLAVVAGFIAFLVDAFMKNTHGFRDALEKLAISVANFVQRLTGGTEGAKKGVGDLVAQLKDLATIALDKIIGFVNWLSDVLDGLTDEDIQHIKDVGKALIGIYLAGKVLGPVVGIIQSVVGVFKTVGTVVSILKGVFNVVSALPSVVTGGVAAIRAIAVAFGILNVALGPIGWAILAIGAAIAALVVAYETNFMGFRDFVDGIVAWFNQNVMPALIGFVNAVGPIVSGVINAIVSFLTQVVETVTGIIDFFANLPANINKFVAEVQANIQNFVSNLFATIGAFLKDLSENWAYYLGYILGRIIGFIVSVIANVAKWLADMANRIITFLSQLPGKFATWLAKTASDIAAWFVRTTIDVAGKTAAMVNAIIDWVQKLPGRVIAWFVTTANDIFGWFTTNIPKIGAKANDIVTSIINFLKTLPSKALSAIANFPTYIRNFLRDVPPRLASAVISIGTGIIKGVWNGIVSMGNWLSQKVTGFFSGLVNGIKDSLGIHSPSRVFADMGTNLILGLAVGIQKTDEANRAMRMATSGLLTIAEAGAKDIGGALRNDLTTGGNFSLTRDNTQTIRLEVNVTSSDGSVSELDMQQLAGLINGGDLVRALEHMASVG